MIYICITVIHAVYVKYAEKHAVTLVYKKIFEIDSLTVTRSVMRLRIFT